MLQALQLALAASLALRSGESAPRAPFATQQQALDGPFAFPSWGSGTAAQRGDLDGDGRDEVLLTGMEGRLALLRFAEDGWTVEPTFLPVLGQAHEVELADLDLDG